MADITETLLDYCDCDGHGCEPCYAAEVIRRLRAERDAIDTLHYPVSSGKDDEVCNNCGCFWPCTTHSLLHPKEARRG